MSLLIGAFMEWKAERFLVQQKLKLIQRNFRTRWGELDLIMLDGDTLVFVEVRYRRHKFYGGAIASLTKAKQQRLTRAAHQFLQRYSLYQHYFCRFDLVAFTEDNKGPEWVKNILFL